MNKTKSIELIKAALNDINSMLPADEQIDIESTDCIRNLDSLQLINLIVSLEEKIEEDLNISIYFSLENENSFLDSIDSLSNYICNNT